MKRIITLMLILVMALSFAACGSDGGKAPAEEASYNSKYTFVYNDTALPMNAEFAPIHETLGEESKYFEAASCAFEGLDKTYTYDGIEIVTYPVEEVDYISSVRILDNSVSTPEGITIGSTMDEVKAAYGEDYEDVVGQWNYTDGDAELSIIFNGEKVLSISYYAINDLTK